MEHNEKPQTSPNWSLALSRVSVVILFVVSVLMLLAGPQLLRWLVAHKQLRTDFTGAIPLLYAVSYLCGAAALATLTLLHRFLGRVAAESVFCTANVRALWGISWCCAAVALLALAAGVLVYLPFAFVGAAAGFMALIVRIIQNAFAQAVRMKHELDLTV